MHESLLATDTYAQGMAFVVGFVFTVLVAVCLLDFICVAMRWPSLGYRVQRWSHTSLLVVTFMLFVLALLLTHFLGNCIHYGSSCPAQ